MEHPVKQIKILTLNTWHDHGPWRERWEILMQELRSLDADIVGFQEVFDMTLADDIKKRSGYPYLAVSGEPSGLVFLSKFRPVEQACLVMDTRSPTEEYRRYAFYVQVEFPGGRRLALFNTHLSWKAAEERVREEQVQELAAFVKARTGALPAVIMGDFNTAPETLSIKFLTGAEKWVDTFAFANPGARGLTWDYKNPFAEKERDKMAERRIDYIFIRGGTGKVPGIVSSQLVFNAPSADGIYPSDHFGVMTDLNFEMFGNASN